MSAGGTAPEDGPLDDDDLATLARLAELHAALDPVPADLADRISFALELDDIETEVARLELRPAGAGAARSTEITRTLTFAADALTVMITVTPLDMPSGHRIDGWVTPGARLPVELRTPLGSRHTRADDVGRFEFETVPPGWIQLIMHGERGVDGSAGHRVVTPAVEL